jgi:hypothetical protein
MEATSFSHLEVLKVKICHPTSIRTNGYWFVGSKIV